MRIVLALVALVLATPILAHARGASAEETAVLRRVRTAPSLGVAVTHAMDLNFLRDRAARKGNLLLLRHVKRNPEAKPLAGLTAGMAERPQGLPLHENRVLWMLRDGSLEIKFDDHYLREGQLSLPLTHYLPIRIGEADNMHEVGLHLTTMTPANLADNLALHLGDEE